MVKLNQTLKLWPEIQNNELKDTKTLRRAEAEQQLGGICLWVCQNVVIKVLISAF